MRIATQSDDEIAYPSSIGFLFIHAGCLTAVWSGVTWHAVALGVILYTVRIFAIGAGYHRYFAHRAFSTSRIAQFALAFLAQTSAQRGILWWASNHRRHHRYSDTVETSTRRFSAASSTLMWAGSLCRGTMPLTMRRCVT